MDCSSDCHAGVRASRGRVRRARFVPRPSLPVDAACVVANGVREALRTLLVRALCADDRRAGGARRGRLAQPRERRAALRTPGARRTWCSCWRHAMRDGWSRRPSVRTSRRGRSWSALEAGRSNGSCPAAPSPARRSASNGGVPRVRSMRARPPLGGLFRRARHRAGGADHWGRDRTGTPERRPGDRNAGIARRPRNRCPRDSRRGMLTPTLAGLRVGTLCPEHQGRREGELNLAARGSLSEPRVRNGHALSRSEPKR